MNFIKFLYSPVSFSFTHLMDMSVFDEHYKNDRIGRLG